MNDCVLRDKNGVCKVFGKECEVYQILMHTCATLRKAYELGKEAGYKEADAMNYYEGSGIGGFHDY